MVKCPPMQARHVGMEALADMIEVAVRDEDVVELVDLLECALVGGRGVVDPRVDRQRSAARGLDHEGGVAVPGHLRLSPGGGWARRLGERGRCAEREKRVN